MGIYGKICDIFWKIVWPIFDNFRVIFWNIFRYFLKIILKFLEIIFHPARWNFSITANTRKYLHFKKHTSMAPLSQPPRIFTFQKNPSYMDLLSQTQRNYRFQEILPQWLFSGKPSRIFPFQKIPPWIFSAKPREFFHSKKNHTSMAF